MPVVNDGYLVTLFFVDTQVAVPTRSELAFVIERHGAVLLTSIRRDASMILLMTLPI